MLLGGGGGGGSGAQGKIGSAKYKKSYRAPCRVRVLRGVFAASPCAVAYVAAGLITAPCILGFLAFWPAFSSVAFVLSDNHTTVEEQAGELQRFSRSAIWLVPAAADAASPPLESHPAVPRQLTDGGRGDTLPRWSPDGRWLAFLSDRGGLGRGGQRQIWLLPAAAVAAAATTCKTCTLSVLHAPDTTMANPSWAPDLVAPRDLPCKIDGTGRATAPLPLMPFSYSVVELSACV